MNFADMMQDSDWDNEEALEAAKGSFGPIPAGTYDALVEMLGDKADDNYGNPKRTKSGDGWTLPLTLQIVGGEYDGRKLFENLNIANPNATAQAIGRKALDSLRKAAGKPAAKDSSELLNAMVRIKVGIDKKDPTKNRVLEYLSGTARAPQPPATTSFKPQGTVVSEAPAASKPAWLKR